MDCCPLDQDGRRSSQHALLHRDDEAAVSTNQVLTVRTELEARFRLQGDEWVELVVLVMQPVKPQSSWMFLLCPKQDPGWLDEHRNCCHVNMLTG